MRRTMIIILVVIFILTACTQTPAPIPTPTLPPTLNPNTLYIDPSKALGEISPFVYGSNYGPWVGISADLLPAAYTSGVTIFRFPAGAWGDHNDLQPLQIYQFMIFLQKVGAKAMISVRLLGGTPEQAAKLVHYVNIESKYNVTYWEIGNEPTLYDGELKTKGERYDTERFNKEWRAIALAMKQVDSTIKLVGPEVHQFSFDVTGTTNYDITTAQDRNGKYWMDEFLKANGDLVDIVSVHRYPFPKSNISGPPTVEELQQNAQEWDKIFVHLRDLIHKNTGRDLPIAFTEFNSAYDKAINRDTTPDSHYNAIWLGDVLGRMIKNGVFMANQWMFTSNGGDGGWGLLGQYDVHPSYYTYQMYKMFGSELVDSFSNSPNLSIYAAKRADGALTVMVINLSLEEQVKSIRIAGQASVKGEAWLFDPTHKAEDIGTVNLDVECKFPPQSMTLFIIK